jgi:multidrug resistance efflux pump
MITPMNLIPRHARAWMVHAAILTATLVAGGCESPATGEQGRVDPSVTGPWIAAGGLVEPVNEERVIIPQISGRLDKVYIDEGDSISAGELIAEVENSELRAGVAAAQAQVELRQAELDSLRKGARPEEIAEATAILAVAESTQRVTSAALQRNELLLGQRQISQARFDEVRGEADSARAGRDRAAASLALLRAGARKEDIRAGEARLGASLAEHDRARALFEKSQIRSPIDGIVLKRDLREGETVVALSPMPLARVGDTRQLRVRADIDELDINRVRVGQAAEIRSEAFSGQHFAGKVIHVSRRMGRRNLSSGDPAEKQDAKILEALILLDGHPALPVGLRVDVFIDTAVFAEPAAQR